MLSHLQKSKVFVDNNQKKKKKSKETVAQNIKNIQWFSFDMFFFSSHPSAEDHNVWLKEKKIA